MNNNQQTYSKVLLHGKGIGGVTEDDIRRRAQELASLNGHGITPSFTVKYLAQARRELTGENLLPAIDEACETRSALTRDPAEPVTQTGHQIPDIGEPNGQTYLEHLTEEGVEEAQHDQMIAARRLTRRQDKKT